MVWGASLCGCARQAGNERYVPTPPVAHSALWQALDAWKKGSPVGDVPGCQPRVHVTDSTRREGQRLADFSILGEVPGDAPRCFAVDLTLEQPAARVKRRYVVVGIDPLWVFRHEDYEMLSHWEHPMPPASAQSRPAPAESTGTVSAPTVDSDVLDSAAPAETTTPVSPNSERTAGSHPGPTVRPDANDSAEGTEPAPGVSAGGRTEPRP